MNVYEHPLYREDVRRVAALPLPWEKLKNCTVLLSGAAGLLGSFLTDVLLERGDNVKIYALGRNAERARARFSYVWHSASFSFFAHNVNAPLDSLDIGPVEYVLHLASNTHPVAYATDPIGTIRTNVIGLGNLLEFAAARAVRRFAFASSNEIYGENRGDSEFFKEDSCGYLDCNTLRAGYPESKRCGEALCQAYRAQKGLDIVIPRLTRSYGPSMLATDTKAISQFLHKAVAGEDIVLKSAGTQFYSYTYMADAVSGLLTVLLCGEDGEAYNIADEASDMTLKELAALIARTAGQKVVFELPDAVEKAGYSRATKARLYGGKLKKLGWQAQYTLQTGVPRTISILRDIS